MDHVVGVSEKLSCAERELAMRKNVYPKWVANGRMKQEMADREIARMAAIVEDYRIMVEGINEPR